VLSRLGDVAGARADAAALLAQGMVLAPEAIRASYPFQDPAHADLLVEAMFAPGIAP